MKNKDEKEMWKLLNVFAEGFRIEKLSAVRAQFYFSALKDLPIETIRDSLNILAGTWKSYGRLPAPVEIREVNQLDADAKAMQAWDITWKSLDPYKSVIFDDPNIMITIEQLGGWIKFASGDDYLTDDGKKWMRKDFINTYINVSKSNINPPTSLQGIIEIGNSAGGYKSPKPVLIGKKVVKELN